MFGATHLPTGMQVAMKKVRWLAVQAWGVMGCSVEEVHSQLCHALAMPYHAMPGMSGAASRTKSYGLPSMALRFTASRV